MEETLEGTREEVLGSRVSTTDYPYRAGRPSRPLLGLLPLRRVIPQDLHSILDYAAALTLLTTGSWCRDRQARNVGAALGAGYLATSLLTDYRLSLAKVIPIEVHEAADYLVGGMAMALPFALAYRNPTARWIHLAIGITGAVASMFTDYRAQKGR